jgi:hypothetical protein
VSDTVRLDQETAQRFNRIYNAVLKTWQERIKGQIKDYPEGHCYAIAEAVFWATIADAPVSPQGTPGSLDPVGTAESTHSERSAGMAGDSA